MTKQTDCLLVGHNEQSLSQKLIYNNLFSNDKVIQRDLNLHYLHFENKPVKFLELLENVMISNGMEHCRGLNNKISDILYPSIVYLGTYLKNHGITFDFINSFQGNKDKLKEKLENCNLVAITTTLYVTLFPVKEIIDFIKSCNNEIKIVVGGPFMWQQFSAQKEKDINTLMHSLNADFYINSSYGEDTLVEIIIRLKTNDNFDTVKNIYYKSEGTYIKTSFENSVNESVRYVADWSLFRDELDLHAWVRTSLSCPFRCSFCDFPPRMGEYYAFSTGDIQKELDSISFVKGNGSVRFVDDTFNIPKKRFQSILNMMIERDYPFKWTSFIRCDLLDDEIVNLMKESGCVAVHLGIESGSNTVLKNMNKRANVEQYEKGISLLHKAGIITYASFIIGFPGETEYTIGETVDFIERTHPGFYFLHPWYCSPTTPVWKERHKYSLEGLGYDWEHSTMKSHEVMTYIENMFLAIKNSVHCSYHGDFTSFLLDYLSIGQLEKFSKVFNEGIKMKLRDHTSGNIDNVLLLKLKQSLS